MHVCGGEGGIVNILVGSTRQETKWKVRFMDEVRKKKKH